MKENEREKERCVIVRKATMALPADAAVHFHIIFKLHL